VLKRYHQVFGSLLIVADICGLIFAWLLAYYLRFYTQIVPVTKGIPPISKYVTLIIPVCFVWLVVFSYFSLYRSQRITRRTTELGKVIRAHGVALLCFVALTYVFTEYRFSRVVIGYFGIISGFYLLAVRLILRNSLRKLRIMVMHQRSVAIVGDGATALALLERIKRMPELGIRVVGFITQTGQGQLPMPVIGSYQDIPEKISLWKIDDLILAMPRAHGAEEERLLADLSKSVIGVHLVPDMYAFLMVGCEVESFDDLPVLGINESPVTLTGKIWKRIMDFSLTLLALLMLSPLFLLISVLVKLTSRGPIFYGQVRMGLDGRTFKMWKFRSMRVDAEKETGAVWAKKDDDRRTPIGAFLRSSSLDELPQLWNVLVGDMSLVGPRPERPEFVHQFRHEIPGYMLRHKVRAGMTGWAQVNGWRGDTSLEKRIECDLYYIRNWSLFLDLKILWMTVYRGFVNKNAY
jgi:Undecaprenyl-phosphate glucose phosphotransferase